MFVFIYQKLAFGMRKLLKLQIAKILHYILCCYFSLRTFLSTVGVLTFKKITVLSEIISRVSSQELVNF